MTIKITIPRLGWSMDEGTFGEWLKASGEFINKGEMVYVLEGEKATQEIESFDSGTLHVPADAPQPGDTVRVGQLIGFLLADGESPPKSVGTTTGSSQVGRETRVHRVGQPHAKAVPPVSPGGRSPNAPKRPAGPAARRVAYQLGIDLDSVSTPDPTGRVLSEGLRRTADSRDNVLVGSRGHRRVVASPRARRRASDLGIDWTRVSGTGRGGRVRERDVVEFAARFGKQSSSEFTWLAPGKHQHASNIRRTIARRMLDGVQKTAPVTLSTKVDATELVALRNRLKAESNRNKNIVPSYSDIIVKLVATALPECELLNACWHNDGLLVYDEINVCVAIDTQFGLMAPVIRDVAALTLNEVAEQSRLLIKQAREGSLSESQLQGGTFTVSNLGMYDIDFFTPILNLPQSAILGIGRIVREPIVQGDEVVAGQTIGVSLTFDHRVVDGAPAARWLQRLSNLIKRPAEAILSKRPKA